MTMTAESLTDRYSRLDSSDLKAIVESSQGDYLPEAREAARAELARRAQSGAPEGLPAEPAARQSRARTYFAGLLIFVGGGLISQTLLSLIAVLLSPSWELALGGAGILFAGLIVTYMASIIDQAFWDRLVKIYAVFGFLRAGQAGLHLVMGKTKSGDDLMGVLQGALLVVLALAVYLWRRRGTERAL